MTSEGIVYGTSKLTRMANDIQVLCFPYRTEQEKVEWLDAMFDALSKIRMKRTSYVKGKQPLPSIVSVSRKIWRSFTELLSFLCNFE